MSTTMKLKLAYGDATTRNYSIADVNPSIDTTFVKGKIKAFNEQADTTDSAVQKTFISDNGYHVTSIIEAEIITTVEEVIYNA